MTEGEQVARYLASIWTGYRALSVAANPLVGLVVALEDDPDGSLRVYFDARSLNHHLHIAEPEVVTAIRLAWAQRPLALPLTPLGWCGCRDRPWQDTDTAD